MYSHALIAMKALPFHKGHEYLIETARKQSERVTVFVVWAARQFPSGPVRAEWVKKTYPDIDVRLVADISTDDDDPYSSTLWRMYTEDILGHDMPDVVFSSEAYGERWAERMGVKHVAVDVNRTRVPISGTQIRSDPYLYWQYLNKYARLSYLKRVLVVGAESTGKTTLCQNLANLYGTLYVPEYGRMYVEQHAPNREQISPEQERIIFANIVNEQPRLAQEIEQDARLVVFHDTDLYVTDLWYKRWQTDDPSDELHQTIVNMAERMNNYDIVLITSPDVPFVDDGYREFSQEERVQFTQNIRGAYDVGKKFVLTGNWDQRLRYAVGLTNGLFGNSNVTLPQGE